MMWVKRNQQYHSADVLRYHATDIDMGGRNVNINFSEKYGYNGAGFGMFKIDII